MDAGYYVFRLFINKVECFWRPGAHTPHQWGAVGPITLLLGPWRRGVAGRPPRPCSNCGRGAWWGAHHHPILDFLRPGGPRRKVWSKGLANPGIRDGVKADKKGDKKG